MKKSFGILFICMLSFVNVFSQNNETIKGFETQMKALVDLMCDAPTDNERFNANEKLIAIFDEVLPMEKSFHYPFDELKRISKLKSSDNRFRIFTWAVVSQDGSFENFGFVQSKNETSGEYEVYKLHDKSDEIFNPEFAKCDNENWFGAVYYDLITTKYEDRTFYTLLGFDGNSIYTKRKIIEPIVFKARSGKPEFGASYFYKDKERKRYIFEYNPENNFILRWDDQYYEDKKVKEPSFFNRIFKKNEYQSRKNNTELTLSQEQMIVYDVLESMFEGVSDMSQFNVASGVVNGFKFERGRWRLVENVLARNKITKKEKKLEVKSNLFNRHK
ncbi:MAG: hypothetical protein WC679_04530 [Bacteroidales bacterium]|jgi:hypothetical protein